MKVFGVQSMMCLFRSTEFFVLQGLFYMVTEFRFPRVATEVQGTLCIFLTEPLDFPFRLFYDDKVE